MKKIKKSLCKHKHSAKYRNALTTRELQQLQCGNIIKCPHCTGYYHIDDTYEDFLTTKQKAIKKIRIVLEELEQLE